MSPEAREPYETLAGAYDGLTTDVDYAAVLQFFETVLQRAGHSPKTVLDLACGTGSMSVLLAGRGYRVIGADISEEMLTAAAQKAAAMAENPPFFICQPMQRLTLPEPVEAIVCLLDSLNYLTEPEDCRKTFHRVWRALRPGGMFFSTSTRHKSCAGWTDRSSSMRMTSPTASGARNLTKKRTAATMASICSAAGVHCGRAALSSTVNMPMTRTRWSSGSARRALRV